MASFDGACDLTAHTPNHLARPCDEHAAGAEAGTVAAPASVSAPFAFAIGALAAATVAQGGFYASGKWLIAAGLGAALAVACRRRPTATWPAAAVVGPMVALAAWAVVRGVQVGDLAAGGSIAALLLAISIVGFVGRRASAVDLGGVYLGVMAVGVGVAVTGWVGIAFHVEPWALLGPTSWRASSTLTYPNAAAAMLAVAACVGVARRSAVPADRSVAVALTLVFAGLGATQSRGGAIALAGGFVVLIAALGPRAVWRSVCGPGLGAAVVFGGLSVGFDPERAAQPVVAVVALIAGVGITVVSVRLPERWVGPVAGGVIAGAAILAVVRLPADRLQIGSSDRSGAAAGALDAIRRNWVSGVGPGRLLVTWDTPGGLVGLELVHNEYLQLLAELGLVGGAFLLAVAVGVLRAVAIARRRSASWSWAGGVSALGALAVHSAFDFLWHIPAVVLMGAFAFVLAVTPNSEAIPERTLT